MSESTTLKARGLYTFQNYLSEIPDGALVQADNVVIDSDGVVSPRRGFGIYGVEMVNSAVPPQSFNAKQLLTYKGRVLRHWGSTLDYDKNNDGTDFKVLSSSVTEPDSTRRIRYVEANGNLYLTTSLGVKKLSAASADAVASASLVSAGGVKALDGYADLNATEGFFTQDSACAYRVVWGYQDANNNVVLGSPSSPIVIYNSALPLLVKSFNKFVTDLAAAVAVSPVTRTGNLTSGSNEVTGINTTGLSVGQTIASVPGYISTYTRISLVDSANNKIVMNQAALGTSSVNLTFGQQMDYSSYGSYAVSSTSDVTTLYTSLKKLIAKMDEDVLVTIAGNTTNGGASVNTLNPSTAMLKVGMFVSGPGIVSGTTILSIDSSTSITLSRNATLTASSTLTFGLYEFSNITPALQIPLDPAPTSDLYNIQNYLDAMVKNIKSNEILSDSGRAAAGGFRYSVKSTTVDLVFQIPNGITTSHFYQIYRTPLAVSDPDSKDYLSSLAPSDEYNLIAQKNATSTSGQVSFYDNVTEGFRQGGAYLYTNANSGEGILQANESPPRCKDIAVFKNTTFYANTISKNILDLTLFGVTDLIGKKLVVKQGSTTREYTFVAVGVSGTNVIEVDTSITLGPSQQIDFAARNIVWALNSDASGVVNAYYMSGISDLPGQMLLEERVLGAGTFYVRVDNASISANFDPELPSTGDGSASSSETNINRIFFSKVQQPDAVPLVNYLDVGAKDKAILRIMPLRDSLFVLTQGGVYRLSGEAGSFQVTLFDSSVQFKAPDTAAVLNNQIYAFTDQGVVSISDTGVSVISRPIENLLLPVTQHANFASASFAVAYESDRAYMIWTTTGSGDTVATQCFRYNSFTTTWVRWPISKTCGLVVPETMIMYLGASDIGYIEKERKSFSRLDYADRTESFAVSPGSITDNRISVLSTYDLVAGDVMVQTQYLTISQFNRLLSKLDRDDKIQYSNFVSVNSASPGDDMGIKIAALASRLDESGSGTALKNYSSAVAAVPGFPNTAVSLQNAFNAIVNKLNGDDGVHFSDYTLSSGTTQFEVIITKVDPKTNQVYLDHAEAIVSGTALVYHAIDSSVTWAPNSFGSPSTLKNVRESTLLFKTASFTSGVASYSSDLSPGFIDIEFKGEGNGSWGNFTWGVNTWGGDGTSRPFRTYIPRQKQRCRCMEPRFNHATALERYEIYGVSFVWDALSSRGYR